MIGRAERTISLGDDVPGRISRLPGGVALNIAMTLARFGMQPSVLSWIGEDTQGDDLMQAVAARGVDVSLVTRGPDLPTDRYMAIEGANGLVAAIADAHSLESAGARILAPFSDGRLISPWQGTVALDGNLTETLLSEIAGDTAFSQADLRIAPASPGKAARLRCVMRHQGATLYVNRIEAGLICARDFPDARGAAECLVAQGAARVLVTDGAKPCAEATRGAETLGALPPRVKVARITGAGDTFMAAHIAAESRGLARPDALEQALIRAADYVAGEIGS
jgi:sugar/nucleoside kinase (ribokinase family)